MNTKLHWVKDWSERAQAVNYRVGELASQCGTSTSRLEKFFLQKFGMTPHELLRKSRLRRALRELVKGKAAKEAAYKAGYKQPSHFSREFKRVYGVPPSRASELPIKPADLDTKR
jgi:AraC-like DNA-binding protein